MNSGMKISFKRILLTIIGIMILGAGVAPAIKAGLGTSSLDVLIELISKNIGISVGRITFFAQMIMVIVSLILYPKNIGIGTVMALILTQFPIDLVYSLTPSSEVFYINLLMVIIGTILTSLGSALIIHAGLGMGTYEALTFSISYHFDIKYLYVKYTLDAVFLIILIIFKGRIGVGTIISYLFIGKLIELFKELFEKTIRIDD